MGNNLTDDVAPLPEVLLLLLELLMMFFLVGQLHQLVQFAVLVLFVELLIESLNVLQSILLLLFLFLYLRLYHLRNTPYLF